MMLPVTELVEGDVGILHLTKAEIFAGGVKASVIEEECDNELDELRESALRRNLLAVQEMALMMQ